MTEAGWTRTKPTAEGWYWNRINGTVGIALIMRRDCQLYAWLKFKDAWLSREGWLDYIHGEWLGPLTPDSYQQGRVEGLREAEDYAERCVKERQLQLLNLGDQAALDPNDRRPGWIRCKASEARRIQVWCIRQTQQAQDEKGVGDAKV